VANVVERYLDAVAAHDWDTAEDCLSADVHRVGPFGDEYKGRDTYLDYLRRLMPSLAGYRMDLHRVLACEGGRTLVAELTETVEMDGRVIETPESLTFDLDPGGRIARIGIYIQTINR
jgi:hypothetical protein